MTHSHRSKRSRRLRVIRHATEADTETPVFLSVVRDTPTKELPSFEQHEDHQGFLHRHDFHRWLLNLMDQVRQIGGKS